jgi:hypothetical protein
VKSLVAAVLVLCSVFVRADDWPDPSPAELAMKTPQIEPDADAEALLWDVRVAHDFVGGTARTERWEHLRIKIFSEAGRDRLGTVDIPYYGSYQKVSDIAGRTIRPDGSIVELQQDSIYDHTLVKAGGAKVNAESFALPGVEVGSIIEYRWKETDDHLVATYLRLEFQRDIPVHLVRYHVRPISESWFPLGMSSLTMHLKAAPFAPEKHGYFVTSAKRIPAFKEERDMPPRAAVRPWILIYYSNSQGKTPKRYWRQLGKRLYDEDRRALKIDPEMRAAAREAAKGANDDEGRLRALFDLVQNKVENTSYDLDEGEQESRPHTEENRTTVDTWNQKAGTGHDLALLYVAMAQALGYDARLARVSRRDLGGFEPRFLDPYFLRDDDVAVKVGKSWRFCDPSYPFLPFGILHSNEEGQAALIPDSDHPEFVKVPIAPPEASEAHREGEFELAPNGMLQGDLRLSYTGHSAEWRRSRYRRQSTAERERSVRDSVKRSLGASEVTAVVLDGLSGSQPLMITCHVEIPSYARRTGQRLLLQPALFDRNDGPRYTASERRYPVMFTNAWSERDAFVYHLPDGFSLENPRSPGKVTLPGVGEYVVRIGLSSDQRTLHYERTFDFGRAGHLTFPATAYPTLKQAFERLRELDGATLSLRQRPL